MVLKKVKISSFGILTIYAKIYANIWRVELGLFINKKQYKIQKGNI